MSWHENFPTGCKHLPVMAITAYALACESQAVGKRMKNSKRQVVWKVVLQKGSSLEPHEIMLKHSILSGKAAVLYDKREVHKANKACLACV